MTGPRRFRAGRFLDAAAVHAAADANPRLQRFMRTIAAHSEAGDVRSRRLLEHLIRRVVDDVGDLHLNNALNRLERIAVLRDNIAAILDHVLEGGTLPEGVRLETLGERFDQLNTEMRELSRPREGIVGDAPLRLADDAAQYADSLLREFEVAGGTSAAGWHVEPAAVVQDAFRAMPADQQAALRRAAELEPEALWRAVAAETESGSRAAVTDLETRLGGRFTPDDVARLRTAVGELGKARSKGLHMNDARLTEALARIADPELRAVVASGDIWLTQQLAVHNPEALATLWRRFRDRGGRADDGPGFRAYLRHDMVTYGRGVLGEYGAAFSLSSIELFLKGPDANVKVAGTDLVGIGHDGWVWLIDDKSHRARSVSGVSALTDNLVTNLRRDASDFRDAIARLQRDDPGFTPTRGSSTRSPGWRTPQPRSTGSTGAAPRPPGPRGSAGHWRIAGCGCASPAPPARSARSPRRCAPWAWPSNPPARRCRCHPSEGAEHGHHQQLHAVRHGAVGDHQRRGAADPALGRHRHLPRADLPPAADRLHRAQGHRGHPRRHHHPDRGPRRRGTLRLEVRPGDDGRGEQTRHRPRRVLRGKFGGLILVTSMTIRTDMQVQSLTFNASAARRDVLDTTITLVHVPRPSLLGKLLDVASIGVGALADGLGN